MSIPVFWYACTLSFKTLAPDKAKTETDAIENVENAKRPQEIANVKKLKGGKSAFRIKIKKYRNGIYIVKDVVEFTRVLPRNKIYSFFLNE